MLIQFCFSFPTASCNYGSHLTDANIGSNFTPGVIPLDMEVKLRPGYLGTGVDTVLEICWMLLLMAFWYLGYRPFAF